MKSDIRSHINELLGDGKYQKFVQAMLAEDDLGLVIRAHLHIEHRLWVFVESTAPVPSAVKRSGYAQAVRTALTLGLDDDFETSLAALGKLRNKFAHEIEMTLSPAAVDSFAGALGPRAKRAVQYTYSTLRGKFPGKPESIRDLNPKDRMGVYLITIHQALVYETATMRERRAHGARYPV
ncbi:hypothetical protein NB311A_06006 [Nitrobacter sp. Nb-311A]|uniref:hypothetical protein n=1 Tax=Nitrobacter sp. Nb-311A TaxID=314253 RepID=UPI0000685299|nr:hypothetical protein [Nitrobacter sp. Nb-311A]EAQ34548.1 hypothetical protein NB311A_06006 [Nitrobacter sp. Nb-311A]